ncbi:MAG: hypothetical protein RI565_03120, partial [Schleiferiaceae bacterium]|nr:hypothetical protein [Schleiferiaceae bacterium]
MKKFLFKLMLGNSNIINACCRIAIFSLGSFLLLFGTTKLSFGQVAPSNSLTFDGLQLLQESDTVSEQIESDRFFMPIGKYSFSTRDSAGLPTLPTRKGTVGATNNFKRNSSRANRFTAWVRFPGQGVGDSVEVRVRKDNPNGFPVDAIWWAISNSGNPSDWVDPQSVDQLPQTYRVPDSIYATSPQPQGLLGPPTTPNWPIGDQSYNKNNRWMRQGYSSNGGLAKNWVATIAVAPCGNYFAFGKYDPWVVDDKYFLQYRAPGGNWQDLAPGDFNSFNPASPGGGCTDDIPDLKLTAAASLEDGGNCQAEQNDEIVYTFTVENTGTVDATKVNISQSSFNGSNSLPVPSLVGGATQATVPASGSVTFTSRYPLSPNDINVGVLNLQVEANAAEITLPTLSDAKTNRVGDLISAPYTKDSDGDGLANNDPTVLGIREINLVKNGSFENSANNFPSTNRGYNQLNAPNNTLDNWLITTGSVDQIYKSYWPPSDGDVSIDMSGVSASKLEQDVSGFIVGNTYRLEFSINRHRTYFRRARKVEMGVSIANLDTSVVIEGTGTNWIRFSKTFKATSPTETLEFNQADFPLPFDAAGMALDDVSIYAPAATESSTNLTHKLSASIEDGGDCSIDVGDKVIYTFTVENVGGADATNVFIKDTLGFTGTGTTPAINFISGTGAAAANFIPQGEKAVFQSEYVLTQADLDSGLIQNQALVYADQLCDPVISDTETRPNGSSITLSLNMDSDGDNINANDATVLTIREINLVNNGSFENSANNFPSGGAGFNQLNAPDSTLDSWYLSDGSLDQIDKSFWIPQIGDISIDMAGISAGKLEQRVYGFLPGRTYRVDFYYTRHRVYFRRPQEVELGVRIANLDTSVTYSGSGTNWVKASLEFVATDTAETIEFNQKDYPLPFTAAGMTIDGVSVYAPSAASPSTELTFIKSASIDDGGDCSFDVGDEVTYTFTVENIGGEDATNVNLVDSLGFLGGSSFPAINFVSGTGGATADIIPAGEKSIYQSTYALTQTDLDSGVIINQARVYADQLCGYELSDTDVRPNGSSISDPLNTDTDGDGVLDNDQTILSLPKRSQAQQAIYVWPSGGTSYMNGGANRTDIDGTGVDLQVTYRSPQTGRFEHNNDPFNVDSLPVQSNNGLYWSPDAPGTHTADFVFNQPVRNVRFRINDLDRQSTFGDAISLFAFADFIGGTAVSASLTPGTSSSPVIVKNNGHPVEARPYIPNEAVAYDSPEGSVLVKIKGPVSAFSINEFSSNGTKSKRINITDIVFETATQPSLSFLKSAFLKDGGDGSVDPGDSITYTFTVENYGGADATNVSILDDNKFSGTGAFPSIKFISGTGGATADTIPIGAKATYEADYVLTQADSDKGLVENQALLYADELCEPLVSDADNGALDNPLGTDSDGDGIADNDKTLTTFLCPTSDASDKSSYVSWSNLTSGIADGNLANSSKTVSCQEATITDAKNNLEKISTGKVQFAEGVVGDFAVEFEFPLYDIEVFVDNLEYSNFIGNFRVILQNGGVLSVGKDWYFDVNYPAPLPYVWQYYSTTGEPARRANTDPALITSSGSKSNDQAGFVIRFNSSIESQIRAAGGAKRIEFETGGSSNKLSAFLGIAGSESSCGGCAPAVDGDNDTLSVLAATGGSINVTANDSVSGQSVQVGTNASVNPFGSWPNGITLSASGFADVAPGTTPGNYSLDYLLCDNASPANCDTVAVEVIVAPEIEGVNDTLAVPATGGDAAVTPNDSVNGEPAQVGTNATVDTLGFWPNGVTLDNSGEVLVAPGTVPGTYPLNYLLCDTFSPPNCDTVDVELTIDPVIDGENDTIVVPSNGGDGLIAPDDSVNGEPALVGTNATVDTVGSWPTGVTLDSKGAVVVAPGTPPATYPLNYLLCDTLSPPNCEEVAVELIVAPVIDGENDTIVAPSTGGGGVIAPNDSVNGEPAQVGTNATVDTVGTWPNGVTLNNVGEVVVAPGTVPGNYPLSYLLCDTLSPPNCDTVLVDVIVDPVINGDKDTVVASSTGGSGPIAPNDSVNGEPAQVGINATVDNVGNWPSGISLDSNGILEVAPGTPPGNYPLQYVLCDTLTPPNCDIVDVDVVVTPEVEGENDTLITPASGGSLSLTQNDTVNGQAGQAGGNASLTTVGNWPNGISLDSNGNLVVAPGTPPGNYPLSYLLCDTLTPPNCDVVQVDVTVLPDINGENDTVTEPATGASAPVTPNDSVNGEPAQPGDNASVDPIGNWPKGLTLDSTGTVQVAPGTTPGSYPLRYLLCDTMTPENCDTVEVDVTVVPVIDGEDDGFVIPASGGGANVDPNDSVNGQPARAGRNATVDPLGTWPAGITIDSTGAVNVAPGTPPGNYPLEYLLCDTLTPANCDTVNVDIDVIPDIDGKNDSAIVPATGGDVGILPNDSVNGIPAQIGVNATVNTVGNWPNGISLNSAGEVVVAPGTTPGTYPLDYLLCDTLSPPNCDLVEVTVTVTPVIDGENDTLLVPATGDSLAITPNDSVNGIPAQVGSNATTDPLGSWPSGITLDSTGQVVVAPGTTPGNYPLSYLLCDTLRPANCDTVEIDLTVTPVIDGVNDTLIVPSTGDSSLITPNDTVNGLPAQAGSNATTNPLGTWPNGITLDSTGAVVVAPGTPPGSY